MAEVSWHASDDPAADLAELAEILQTRLEPNEDQPLPHPLLPPYNRERDLMERFLAEQSRAWWDNMRHVPALVETRETYGWPLDEGGVTMPKTMELRDGDRVIRGYEHAGEAYAYEEVGDGPKSLIYDSVFFRDTEEGRQRQTWIDGFSPFENMALFAARTMVTRGALTGDGSWHTWPGIPAAVRALDGEGRDDA